MRFGKDLVMFYTLKSCIPASSSYLFISVILFHIGHSVQSCSSQDTLKRKMYLRTLAQQCLLYKQKILLQAKLEMLKVDWILIIFFYVFFALNLNPTSELLYHIKISRYLNLKLPKKSFLVIFEIQLKIEKVFVI